MVLLGELGFQFLGPGYQFLLPLAGALAGWYGEGCREVLQKLALPLVERTRLRSAPDAGAVAEWYPWPRMDQRAVRVVITPNVSVVLPERIQRSMRRM